MTYSTQNTLTILNTIDTWAFTIVLQNYSLNNSLAIMYSTANIQVYNKMRSSSRVQMTQYQV